jgi:hypothetical protein
LRGAYQVRALAAMIETVRRLNFRSPGLMHSPPYTHYVKQVGLIFPGNQEQIPL